MFKEDEIDARAGSQHKASDFPPQPGLRLAMGHRGRMLSTELVSRLRHREFPLRLPGRQHWRGLGTNS